FFQAAGVTGCNSSGMSKGATPVTPDFTVNPPPAMAMRRCLASLRMIAALQNFRGDDVDPLGPIGRPLGPLEFPGGVGIQHASVCKCPGRRNRVVSGANFGFPGFNDARGVQNRAGWRRTNGEHREWLILQLRP